MYPFEISYEVITSDLSIILYIATRSFLFCISPFFLDNILNSWHKDKIKTKKTIALTSTTLAIPYLLEWALILGIVSACIYTAGWLLYYSFLGLVDVIKYLTGHIPETLSIERDYSDRYSAYPALDIVVEPIRWTPDKDTSPKAQRAWKKALEEVKEL